MKTNQPVAKNRNNRKQLVHGRSALQRVHKYFPNVKKVIDAKESIFLEVTNKDLAKASKKDPKNCALARACKRQEGAQGAIIGIGTSYVIKDNVATRFLTSAAVGREIVSFDRHGEFQPGSSYTLSAIPPTLHLTSGRKIRRVPKSKNRDIVHRHRTANIRVL